MVETEGIKTTESIGGRIREIQCDMQHMQHFEILNRIKDCCKASNVRYPSEVSFNGVSIPGSAIYIEVIYPEEVVKKDQFQEMEKRRLSLKKKLTDLAGEIISSTGKHTGIFLDWKLRSL